MKPYKRKSRKPMRTFRLAKIEFSSLRVKTSAIYKSCKLYVMPTTKLRVLVHKLRNVLNHECAS